MDLTTIIGFTAATLTLCASLPQIIKVWKTKKTKDLAMGMYLMLSLGVILWTIYGILRNDIVLITMNSTALILYISIILLKIKYG